MSGNTNEDAETEEHGANCGFLRTKEGVLKIIQFGVSVVAACTIASSYEPGTKYSYGDSFRFFESVTISASILTLLVIICNLARVERSLNFFLNLPLTVLVYDGFLLIFYVVASILLWVLVKNCNDWLPRGDARTAAATLGVIASILFGMSCVVDYFKLRRHNEQIQEVENAEVM